MNDKTKDIFRSIDDGPRLFKGEWTSDGRKLFRFLITGIHSNNFCSINENEKRLNQKFNTASQEKEILQLSSVYTGYMKVKT